MGAKKLSQEELQKLLEVVCSGNPEALNRVGIFSIEDQASYLNSIVAAGGDMSVIPDNKIALYPPEKTGALTLMKCLDSIATLPHVAFIKPTLDAILEATKDNNFYTQKAGEAIGSALEAAFANPCDDVVHLIASTLIALREDIANPELIHPQDVRINFTNFIVGRADKDPDSLSALCFSNPELWEKPVFFELTDIKYSRDKANRKVRKGKKASDKNKHDMRHLFTLVGIGNQIADLESMYHLFPDFIALGYGINSKGLPDHPKAASKVVLDNYLDAEFEEKHIHTFKSVIYSLLTDFDETPYTLVERAKHSSTKQFIMQQAIEMGYAS